MSSAAAAQNIHLEFGAHFSLLEYIGPADLSHLKTSNSPLEVQFPYGVLSGVEDGEQGILYALEVVRPIAERIWRYGTSHRLKTVGGVAVAQSDLLHAGELLVVWANNQKVLKGEDPNRACSEEFNLAKLRTLAAWRLAAMVVYAEGQPDDETNIDEGILPMCGSCRGIFAEDPLVTPDTVFLTHDPVTGTTVSRPVEAWLSIYGKPNTQSGAAQLLSA